MKKSFSFLMVLMLILLIISNCFADTLSLPELSEAQKKEYKKYVDFCKENALYGTKKASDIGYVEDIVIIIPKKETNYKTHDGKSWTVSPNRPFVMLSYKSKKNSSEILISMCYLLNGTYKNPNIFSFASNYADDSFWAYELAGLATPSSDVYYYLYNH